jgi:hypothetical protein
MTAQRLIPRPLAHAKDEKRAPLRGLIGPLLILRAEQFYEYQDGNRMIKVI